MTNESASLPAGGPRPPRRGRRLLIALLAVFVLVGVVLDRAYRYAVRPERLIRLTEEHLSRFVTGQVRIGDARLALFEGIRLSDVTIVALDSTGDAAGASTAEKTPPVFSCRRVELRHRPFALLMGNLQIDSVTAFEPTCTLVHDDTTGRTNISNVLRSGLGAEVDRLERHIRRQHSAPDLPVIELRDARIRVLDRKNGELREVENLVLSVRARPAAHDAERYDIVWNAPGTGEPHFHDGHTSGGHSQLDLNTGYVRNIQGGLPSMSIEAVMLAVNARYDGVGAWTNLLGLGGRVRAVDYNLIGDPLGPDDRSVTIELSDAAISIPVDATEHPLPREQRYLRFAHVNGTIVVTTQALRADFTGEFHGSRCSVRATLRSDLNELRSLDDVDFDVELTARELRVPRIDDDAPPEQRRFVRRFRALAGAYEDFDPHGVVNLDIHATKRAGADEPVHLQNAMISVLNGDAAFEYFPYRGYNMTGTIEFKPEGVFVRELRGEHGGGVVTINGWMAAPSVCAELKFDANGRNILIDDALRDALRPEHRRTAMRFDPQGRLDIDVALHRSACIGDERRGKWSTVVTLNLKDNQATYEDFPYPIEALTGTIIIGPHQARVIDVRGRPVQGVETSRHQQVKTSNSESAEVAASSSAPNAGDPTIGVRGDVFFDDGDVNDIDLIVTAVNIPVDDALTAALPESMGHRLRDFQPEGEFHCETRLTFDPLYRSVRHESRVVLGGLNLRHKLVPAPFQDVTGTLWIDSHLIHAERVTAHRNDSVVTVNGSIDPLDPDRHTDLKIEARHVEWIDDILNAVPESWRVRLGEWRVDGPIDLYLRLQRTFSLWNISGSAHFDGADVHYKQGPLRVTDVRGAVSFDSTGVQGRKLTGRFGEAAVQLDFDTQTRNDRQHGNIRLAATRLPLDRTLRDLLPERMHASWERLAPAGVVDLLLERLEFTRDGQNEPIWTVDGRVVLHDVDFYGDADITGATGTMTFGGTLRDRLGGSMISGQLRLDRVILLERQLRNYQSGLSLVQTADGSGRFDLSNAQAELYDGFVAGDLEILMSPTESTYNLSTTIQRAQLDLMLIDGRRLSTEPSEPMTMHGMFDATLYLSGILGQRETRRGGGRFEISAGQIYKLPLMSAILHVLNLSLPLENSLESAQASFYVVGDRVDLPSVALRGSGIELAGSGSLTLPNYVLDVTLVNVNPRRWARVPVLSDIVEGASREFIVLHVTGPIGRPTVRTRPLAALGDEFKRLFQRRGSPETKVTPASE